MKDYRKAAKEYVRFVHHIVPATKHLKMNSKMARFKELGALAPDFHAATAYIELEFSVGLNSDIQPSEFNETTPLQFCQDGLQDRKLSRSVRFQYVTLISEIYREYITASLGATGSN